MFQFFTGNQSVFGRGCASSNQSTGCTVDVEMIDAALTELFVGFEVNHDSHLVFKPYF